MQTALQRALASACNMIPGRVGPYRLVAGWYMSAPRVPAVYVYKIHDPRAPRRRNLRFRVSPNLVTFLAADYADRRAVLRVLADELPQSRLHWINYMLHFRPSQDSHGAARLKPSAWYASTCMGRYGAMPGNRTWQALNRPFVPLNSPGPAALNPEMPVYPGRRNAFAPGAPEVAERAGGAIDLPHEDMEDEDEDEWINCFDRD